MVNDLQRLRIKALFSRASLSQQTEFVTHLYQKQNPQVYTDIRSLQVGLKTPQTPGNLPLDVTGRTTLSQSNPVVNSKARFQPARGVFFRQATPSLVRSRGDQQHSLTSTRLVCCFYFWVHRHAILSEGLLFYFLVRRPMYPQLGALSALRPCAARGPLSLLFRPPFVAP